MRKSAKTDFGRFTLITLQSNKDSLARHISLYFTGDPFYYTSSSTSTRLYQDDYPLVFRDMADILELDRLIDFGDGRPLHVPPAGDGSSVAGGSGADVDEEMDEEEMVPPRHVDAQIQADEQSTFQRYVPRFFPNNESSRAPKIDLSSFWDRNPVLWFAQAEGIFELQNETDSRRKFFHVLKALNQVILSQVADLVECVPVNSPYEILKARLLSASKKTDFQKAEMVMALPALGDRKPSALLAEMLELCPRGWEHDRWFSFLFLSRLPMNVRVLLRGQQTVDLRLLAEQADEVAALFTPGQVSGAPFNHVSQVDQQQADMVAAVGTGQPHTSRPSQAQHQQQHNRHGQGKTGHKGKGRPETEEQKSVRLKSGLCLAHWRYGPRCFPQKCQKPCVLSEN
jgi:hypothetical protein